jgi:hypothetical protein
MTTNESRRTDNGTGRNARETVATIRLESDCEGMSVDESKLPRQDSNLDKENQNLLSVTLRGSGLPH